MAWKQVHNLKHIKVGDSLRVGSAPPFVVQAVIGHRGYSVEVVSHQGYPMEIRDTDDVYRLEK